MNSVHDIGGTVAFGPIVPEPDEPVFHDSWEKRAFAVSIAVGATGFWNLPMLRHAIERIAPARYLAARYYEKWLEAVEVMTLRHGLVTEAELDAGAAAGPGPKPFHVLCLADVEGLFVPAAEEHPKAPAPARFAVGDQVRARNLYNEGHTRLPRYVRGRQGKVTAVRGVLPIDDATALGRTELQWCYTVAFSGPELWGEGSDPRLTVSIEAWESYLEPT
jgi:nitrile hydratase